MKVVFLGPPGVGKGTQAKLLEEHTGWAHISTGEILRDAVAKGTDLGLKARMVMNNGDLVGDDLILALIEETVDDLKGAGCLFDGFPRTEAQAEGLDRLLEARGDRVSAAILLTAPRDELVARLSERGRLDDTPETVNNRLEVYEEKTAPLVDYYRRTGVLKEVDGLGGIPEIQDRIRTVLD